MRSQIATSSHRSARHRRSWLMGKDAVPIANSTDIARRILVIRGRRVLVDADIAALYAVTTKRLNEQIKRNRRRFPRDFVFQLTSAERDEVVANCDHLARLRFSPKLPYAFTEHGAIMAASVLNTPRAVDVSVFVVRAFIRLRDTIASNRNLAKKLDELEKRTGSLASKHDALAATTRNQLRQVIETLRQLMAPQAPRRRSIGFVRQD